MRTNRSERINCVYKSLPRFVWTITNNLHKRRMVCKSVPSKFTRSNTDCSSHKFWECSVGRVFSWLDKGKQSWIWDAGLAVSIWQCWMLNWVLFGFCYEVVLGFQRLVPKKEVLPKTSRRMGHQVDELRMSPSAFALRLVNVNFLFNCVWKHG